MLKVATWNVNSIRIRLPQLLDWLHTQQPDILALQETKITDPCFPKLHISEAGYQVVFSGQKSYNGVAILSRLPANGIVTDMPGLGDPQRRVLGATIGGIRVLNVYIPNGQSIGSKKYDYKISWLDKLHSWVTMELSCHRWLFLIGDFNIAPEDRDIHSPIADEERVICSKPERFAFQQLMQLGLRDTFRMFPQKEQSFSWWDYRFSAFHRNVGMRIDHILISQALADVCISCYIDEPQRRLARPSDHAPVISAFNLELY
jgi:exodeoxyribonuclease-3